MAYKGTPLSLETRQKIRVANMGEKNHRWGKHWSEEDKARISASLKGRAKSPEHIKNVADAQRGKPRPNISGHNHWNWKARSKEERAGRPKPEICEVCGSGGAIMFDHDHKTGQFRGWICRGCNTALGHTRDSIEVLSKLIIYLQDSQNNQTPSFITPEEARKFRGRS